MSSVTIIQGSMPGVPWQAITVLIVGLAAASIAFVTAYIQKRKLDLDLFDRRYEFYTVLRQYVRATRFRNGPSATLEKSFVEKSNQAKLLFPKAAASLIEEIAILGDEYQDLNEKKVSDNLTVRNKALARRKAIRLEQDALFEKFQKIAEKFMRFDF